jgi:peptidoglycan L-alanyl-D-glutamate endopeptidase CwlK
MSHQLFTDDVRFLQRFLKCSHLYDGDIDGDWGPRTDAAVTAFETACAEIAATHGSFETRSERCIHSLQPRAQKEARAFLQRVRGAGIDARIISGTRTYAEQDALYRKGRFGDTSAIVTNAEGGHSNHNFGIAWDIGIFDRGRYLGESPLYTKAARVGLVSGLEWGGNWRSFVDPPHYQLATGVKLAAVRTSFEAGTAFV